MSALETHELAALSEARRLLADNLLTHGDDANAWPTDFCDGDWETGYRGTDRLHGRGVTIPYSTCATAVESDGLRCPDQDACPECDETTEHHWATAYVDGDCDSE